MSERKTFTGRARRRRTTWTVRLVDFVAQGLITIGGIGTILAVSLVCLFLLYVTVPLFRPAQIEATRVLPAPWPSSKPLHFEVEEYQTIGWSLSRDGQLRVFRPDNGGTIETQELFDREQPTAATFSDGQSAVVAFADGTVRIGSIGFETQFLEPEQVDEAARRLLPGEAMAYENGMLQRTPQRQFRLLTVAAEFGEPLELAPGPIRLIDYVAASSGPVLVTYSGGADNSPAQLQLHTLREQTNLLLGDTQIQLDESVELPLVPSAAEPQFLLLSGRGDTVYLAWDDGTCFRYDARNLNRATLAERLDLAEGAGQRLTALKLLLGRGTLIAGDSDGRVSSWFLVRSEQVGADRQTTDGAVLTQIQELQPPGGAAVTALGMSARSRMTAAGFADGRIGVYFVTNEQTLATTTAVSGEAIQHLVLSPADDGLYAAAGSKLWAAEFDPGHPEASLAALFRPVWYEGYPEPDHVWQSTGSTVDMEPKLGLQPLVFGTIKATFYTMLIGVPLALLAAVYTSEFLHPRMKSKIKPAVEMMASLPSVVLGFLAALVFAVWAQQYLPAVLTSFLTIPYAFALGAYLWQMLPHGIGLRLAKWRFVFILGLAIPAGLLAAVLLGPVLERWLFAGDLLRWLDSSKESPVYGSSVGGWLMLVLPLSAVAGVVLSGRVVTPRFIQKTGRWGRGPFVGLDFLKFLLSTLLALAVALGVSLGLSALGFDPRGSYLDTYAQRNAMVVGFVMGFAVIPIIYTIAEDALAAVPEQLRSASLGAGATPWQTTVRIVIPTAMSGLFSAIMVGLGRAVGETMIVLMAGGNTPVINWNPFEGFRTLSANIAVELPEAVRDSTHYRTLFLAALTLFIMTFAVNTAAEIVRLRFRRRVYQL